MTQPTVNELVKQVTGVAIGDGTDQPSRFEGIDGRNGLLTVREHLLDDEDYFSGESSYSDGTLLDVLQGAASEGGKFGSVTIDGLSPQEAALVLGDPKYLGAATEIASVDGDLCINGINYELVDGKFVEFKN